MRISRVLLFSWVFSSWKVDQVDYDCFDSESTYIKRGSYVNALLRKKMAKPRMMRPPIRLSQRIAACGK